MVERLLITAVRMLSSEIERAHFSSSVTEQIKQTKIYLESSGGDVSKIRSGLVLLENAVNNISTNSFHSSLYFLGRYRFDNIGRYNELCRTIAEFHYELGDSSLGSFWNEKIIEITDPYDDYAPVVLSHAMYD